MTIPTFRPRVGRSIVRQSVGPVTAQDTFSARRAMQDIIREFKRFVEHIEGVTPQVLVEALQPTFDRSQEIVPRDTGALKESGYLEEGIFRGKATVEIGYGRGGRPDYAATVHENLEFFHEPPTQAKFLQTPLEEDAQKIQDRIIMGLKQGAGT